MHEYDVALKRILTRPGSLLLKALTGCSEVRWLNVELPKVNNLRVDLLGVLPNGDLIHIEFQSRNERRFWLRMAEYLFAIRRSYGRFPRQIAVYVGDKPMRMKSSVTDAGLTFRFDLVDMRELDGEALIASENLSDNVIAILSKLGDQPGTLRRILRRIAEGPAEERSEALSELSILAGLRRLTGELRREEKNMPITEDIMDNEIIGPMIRRGISQGRVEGQLEMLLALIESRFGTVTPRIRKCVAAMQAEELKALGLRLLQAERIGDLFA